MLHNLLASPVFAALAQHGDAAAHAPEAHATTAVLGAMRHAPSYFLLIALLPFLTFVLSGLCAAFRVKSKLPAWLTVASLAGSFLLTLKLFLTYFTGTDTAAVHVYGFEWLSFAFQNAGEKAFVSNFAFYIDSLTTLWMLFVTGLATLIALYSSEYMSADLGSGYNRYFAAFNLFVFSMSCLVMADNLLLLFLGWEGVGLCSYLLIGYFYKRPAAVAAAKKAFIMNRIGDLGLLTAIFTVFVVFGTVEYEKLFPMIAAGVDGAGNPISGGWVVKLIPLLLVMGAFGKSAQLFLYTWLPDAMEGPTPVSALIHAATMVTAGVFLIARMYPLFMADPSHTVLSVVAWGGAITALFAATIGMAYYDIKRVMGYSTVSQLGYMFAGLGVLGSAGGVFHVFTHAFFKATLFLCCGAVMHGFAGQLDLRKLSGVMKMKGWLICGLAMVVGCLNLAGFPFTAGFFSKDMILAQAFSTPCTLSGEHASGIAGAPFIGWILLLTAGMTAYYTFRVFFRVFLGPKEFEPGDEVHGHDDHAHDGHAHDGHGHDHGHAPAPAGHEHGKDHHGSHGDFHPHAPGWAMNFVMATCALLSLAAVAVYFIHTPGSHAHGGWVATMVGNSPAHVEAPHGGTFLGMDPHKVMYWVSGVVGGIGIMLAAVFQLFGRKHAATAPADKLFGVIPGLKSLHTAANSKWYVDEIYDFLIVRPLWVLSHIFHLIDQYIVDGIVNLFGAIPRLAGKAIRPLQSGETHGYALGMAGGLAVLLVIVIALSL
ncbi:MAG TPA: NADH-quinone oxidoreductase subunit L [Phycisphaerales bacterium]|nr:NADH-quinone oxidoreductase subunit L [Phycisphaerales bacterium]